jgi:WD40 repeat protein
LGILFALGLDTTKAAEPAGAAYRVLSTGTAEIHQLTGMALSPDGDTIAVGTLYGAVQLWDWRSATELKAYQIGTRFVTNLLFMDSGKLLCVLTDAEDLGQQEMTFVRLASGEMTDKVGIDSMGRGFTLPNGDVGLQHGAGMIFLDRTGTYTGRAVPFEVDLSRAALSPNGRIMVGSGSSSHYEELTFLDGEGKFQRSAELGYRSYDTIFSPDGSMVAVMQQEDGGGSDPAAFNPKTNGYDLFDVSTGRKLHRFAGHDRYLSGAAFSPDGKQFLTWSADKTLILSDIKSGAQIFRMRGHRDGVADALFLDGGRLIASNSNDGSTKIWSTRTGEQIVSLHALGDGRAEPSFIAIRPNGHFTEGGNRTFAIVHVKGGKDGAQLTEDERATLKLPSIKVADDMDE